MFRFFFQDLEADPRRKAELSIPIVAYPETLWKKRYRVCATRKWRALLRDHVMIENTPSASIISHLVA